MTLSRPDTSPKVCLKDLPSGFHYSISWTTHNRTDLASIIVIFTFFFSMMLAVNKYLSAVLPLILLVARSSVKAQQGCPCVPDSIKFSYDFDWGCNHPPSNDADFSFDSCMVSGRPRNSSIKKIVYEEKATGEVGELDIEVLEHGLGQKTYTFVIKRSLTSPTHLFLDFYQTYSATGSPVASVDLVYDTGSVNCFNPRNPIFWAGDIIYFLDVVSLSLRVLYPPVSIVDSYMLLTLPTGKLDPLFRPLLPPCH